jgi:comEA protein
LRKKTLNERNSKEKYKCLAVVVIFLICGICYSHSFYSGRLEMGRKIAVDEIGITENTAVSAADVIGKIDINTAETEELMLLPSVGEGRAEDIIEYREENGDFSCIEDIMQVSGIGEKTFEEIKEQITVGE